MSDAAAMKQPVKAAPETREEADLLSECVMKIRTKQRAWAVARIKEGDSLMAKGSLNEAIIEYQKVARHREWNALGWRREGTGEYLIPYAYGRLAIALEGSNYLAEARSASNAKEDLEKELKAYNEGRAAMLDEDYEKASGLFIDALEKLNKKTNRKSSQSRLMLAHLTERGEGKPREKEEELKAYRDAIDMLDELLKEDRDCVEALEFKARLCKKLGEKGKAEEIKDTLVILTTVAPS